MPPQTLRHHTRILLLLVGCWLVPLASFAIDPQRALSQTLLRKWQVQQGLPQPTITSITQTRNGALWLGTPAGLYQFDGVRFDAALVIDGQALENASISDLCEDRAGNLWIATRNQGLLSLRAGELTRHDAPVGFPTSAVHCLTLDRNGDLWAGGEGGLARLHEGTFRRYGVVDGLRIAIVHAIVESETGALWIGGTGEGLSEFRDNVFHHHPGPVDRVVRALLSDRDGSVWVGTNDGLIRRQGEVETRYTTADGLADNVVECLTRTRDGTLWAGTRNGLCRLRDDMEFECFRVRDGLTQSTVFTIWEDHEEGLWVGTKHGLNQFTDRRTLPLTMTEGLPSNDAGPMVQSGNGDIWIGTLDQGLARYDGRVCARAFSLANGLPGNRITALIASDEADVWIGTSRGLALLRESRIIASYTTDNGLPAREIRCLAIDKAGTLWVGTARGLVKFDQGKFLPATDGGDLSSLPISVILDTGPEGLIVATPRNVFRLLDGQVTRLHDDPNPIRDVTALARGPGGELWMATRGRGLLLLDQGKLTRFTVDDGLYDDEIVGIVFDDDNKLWMACSRGIFWVTRADLLEFAAGRLKVLKSWSFSPMDALRTVECQRGVQPAVTRADDGQLWFSTIHGIIVLDPKVTFRVLPPPLVDVAEVLVNGRPVATDQPLTLPPGILNLAVRYTAHSFAAPTRTKFRYRLEGFDTDWIDAGTRREAFYTNLSPGTYRFVVSAANADGPWTESTAPIELTLTPSFWQTLWFPAAAGVASLALIWLIQRLRVLRVRSHMGAIVAERTRIARELHDTLIQGFSGVTMQMQAVSSRLPEDTERRALDEVIADAGACLREARQSVAGLRNSRGSSMGLSAAIAETARQLTETRNVKLHLALPAAAPLLPVETEFNLLRIASEAINNAARHAHAHTIDVSLNHIDGRLALRIRDDGVGFSLPEKEQTNHGHYGLIGMRERSRQIAADLTIQSDPGSGTTILVDLPIAHPRIQTPVPSPPNPQQGTSI